MATRNEIKKINRRIDFLMSSGYGIHFADWEKSHKDACIAVIVSGVAWRNCLDAPFDPRDYKKQGYLRANIQIMILAMEINLSVDDVAKRCAKHNIDRKESRDAMKGSPQKEGRDNKGVYVGSGGGGSNRVRYPKLNRSKKVWKMFYKMFPYYAERDNWDGEKSDRYPRKTKKKRS